MYRIAYHHKVLSDDVRRIDTGTLEKLMRAIENKLLERPELYGQPLRAELKGRRKLRVGDYRIIFVIKKENVRVLAMAHRSVVYDLVRKRI